MTSRSSVNDALQGERAMNLDLMPIYQTQHTSRPAKGDNTSAYLPAGLRIDRPNQVW